MGIKWIVAFAIGMAVGLWAFDGIAQENDYYSEPQEIVMMPATGWTYNSWWSSETEPVDPIAFHCAL